MATEINVHGHLITNTYKTITPEYASLHIVQTSGVYEFKTLVNTCFINELKKFIWFRLNTADGTYFATSLNNDNKKILSQLHIFEDLNKTMLLHRFIAALARLPNPRNEIYVDHIDRQTLDNRRENLRWYSQADQNRNMDKKKRQINARPLPTDIEPGPLPKYVTWNSSIETTKAGTVLTRNFFRIECHPALDGKTWSSSKAAKFTNQQKLNDTRIKLAEFDQLINPDPDMHIRLQLLHDYKTLMS